MTSEHKYPLHKVNENVYRVGRVLIFSVAPSGYIIDVNGLTMAHTDSLDYAHSRAQELQPSEPPALEFDWVIGQFEHIGNCAWGSIHITYHFDDWGNVIKTKVKVRSLEGTEKIVEKDREIWPAKEAKKWGRKTLRNMLKF